MKTHLLVADDDPNLLDILRITFERPGYCVTTMTESRKVLPHLMENGLPSMVIVGDLVPRPEASLSLVHDLRTSFAGLTLPILMISTGASEHEQSCGRAAGADRYLTKPFALATLITTVEELLQKAA